MSVVIRPIQSGDLDRLYELAQMSSGGITSLPADKALLEWKIERSHFAFSVNPLRPKGEAYLFVLTIDGTVVGCCGILSKTGGYEPLYVYDVKSLELSSDYLEVAGSIDYLELDKIYNGPSEVCTLFLNPNHRKGGLGRLLSLTRLLFISTFPKRFDKLVMGSFRGIVNEGHAPFYERILRPFFQRDFDEITYLRYKDPRFVQDLIPPYPLFVPHLPRKIQEVIGKTHPNTEPAVQMLRQEGFSFCNWIDPFDGGPFYTCPLKELRINRERQTGVVQSISSSLEGKREIIGNDRLDFRATYGHVDVQGSGVVIAEKTAHALEVSVGDRVSWVNPHAKN